jgi:hypothetical protein
MASADSHDRESSALAQAPNHLRPRNRGRDCGIRRRLASAHQEVRPQPVALPARPGDRQWQLPRLDRRLPPQPPDAAEPKRTRRRRRLFYDVRHMNYAGHNIASPTPGARHGSARWSYLASRKIATTQPRACPLHSACPARRLGEQEMPPPFSRQRRRTVVESGEWPVVPSDSRLSLSIEHMHEKPGTPRQCRTLDLLLATHGSSV